MDTPIVISWYYIQDLRNCHNTRLVRDTENIVTTFNINQSVTAPYKKICQLRQS